MIPSLSMLIFWLAQSCAAIIHIVPATVSSTSTIAMCGKYCFIEVFSCVLNHENMLYLLEENLLKIWGTWWPSVHASIYELSTLSLPSVIYQIAWLQNFFLPGLLLTETKVPLIYVYLWILSLVCLWYHFSDASCEACPVLYFSEQYGSSLALYMGQRILYSFLFSSRRMYWLFFQHPPDPSFQWVSNKSEILLLIKKKNFQELMSEIRCTHPPPSLLPEKDLGSPQNFQLPIDNPSK